MTTTPTIDVVDHGDKLTVFLPTKAGIDVFKGRMLRCEQHGLAGRLVGRLVGCAHISAAERHIRGQAVARCATAKR